MWRIEVEPSAASQLVVALLVLGAALLEVGEVMNHRQTVREDWESFSRAAIPHDAPEDQLREMRRAFFVGAHAVLCDVMAMLDPGHKPTRRTNTPDATTWVKIKNRQYSQASGREDFFDRQKLRK